MVAVAGNKMKKRWTFVFLSIRARPDVSLAKAVSRLRKCERYTYFISKLDF